MRIILSAQHHPNPWATKGKTYSIVTLTYGIFQLVPAERETKREVISPPLITLESRWGDTICPLKHLPYERWTALRKPVSMHVTEEDDLYIWGGDRQHVQTVEVTFVNREDKNGPWAKFEIALAPIDSGLAIQLLHGLTPDWDEADLPHTPLGLDFRIVADLNGAWTHYNPIFVMAAVPTKISGQFLTEQQPAVGVFGVAGVTFMMNVGQAVYQWTPTAACVDWHFDPMEKGGNVMEDCLAQRVDRNPRQDLRSNHFFLPHRGKIPKAVSLQALKDL